jgi:hypothetical protein
MARKEPDKKKTTVIDYLLVAILVTIGLIVIFCLLHLDALWNYSSMKSLLFSW